MPIHIDIDIETDTLYLRGIEKGIEKGRIILEKEREERRITLEMERTNSVLNLWRTGMEQSIISNCLNLPMDQVERIIVNA
jgi:hypothetical protein